MGKRKRGEGYRGYKIRALIDDEDDVAVLMLKLLNITWLDKEGYELWQKPYAHGKNKPKKKKRGFT